MIDKSRRLLTYMLNNIIKTNKQTKTGIAITGPLKAILVRVQKCEESALTILGHVSYAGQSIDLIMERNVYSDKISDRNE